MGTSKDSIITHVLKNHKENLQVSVWEEPEEIKETSVDVKTLPRTESSCDKPACGFCSQFVDSEEELRFSHKVPIFFHFGYIIIILRFVLALKK